MFYVVVTRFLSDDNGTFNLINDTFPNAMIKIPLATIELPLATIIFVLVSILFSMVINVQFVLNKVLLIYQKKICFHIHNSLNYQYVVCLKYDQYEAHFCNFIVVSKLLFVFCTIITRFVNSNIHCFG